MRRSFTPTPAGQPVEWTRSLFGQLGSSLVGSSVLAEWHSHVVGPGPGRPCDYSLKGRRPVPVPFPGLDSETIDLLSCPPFSSGGSSSPPTTASAPHTHPGPQKKRG